MVTRDQQAQGGPLTAVKIGDGVGGGLLAVPFGAVGDGSGDHQLAVDAYQNGFFSSGILMDIPRLKGVDYLEVSTPIYPEDLEAWEKQAGIKVGPGRHRVYPDEPLGSPGREERTLEYRQGNGRVACIVCTVV